MIWNHLNELIPKQKSIMEQIKGEAQTNIVPQEIATIEFGYLDFGKYETL